MPRLRERLLIQTDISCLPKERIGHCHCKDAVKKGKGYDWAPMGGGIIDWAGQFKALKRDGYRSPSASKRTGTAEARRKNARGRVGQA